MGSIEFNLQGVRDRIGRACEAAGRSVESVTLLAVSKTFPADAVREAHAAGLRAFGENYVQEGLAKIEALADLRPQLQWHLIGPLQSSKSGALPAEVPALAKAVAALAPHRLVLRGLMAIPEPAEDPALQRLPHRALRELLVAINAQGQALDVLSMGMSADLEAAVQEGATLVRVGTALFGRR